MRATLHAAGMLLLGAACLLTVGVGYDWRLARPLPLDHARTPIATAGGHVPSARVVHLDAMSTALRGLSITLRAAADAIEHQRSDAAPLLDAGWRVAQVIGFVAARTHTHLLADEVARARHEFQNGRRFDAVLMARRAAVDADTAAGAALPPVPATDATYRDAVVLDATGNVVGTVIAIDDHAATIESLGLRQLLGFVTLSRGDRVDIPRAAVLLGEPHAVGETLAIAAAAGEDDGA